MEHREAAEHLLDYVGGRCDHLILKHMASHIETCSDCRTWVETHDLLIDFLKEAPGGVHPDSEVLARYALQSEKMNQPERSAIGLHIEGCDVCRRDVEAVRSAVLKARTKADRALGPALATPVSTWWRIAAAACVAFVALWSVLSIESRHPGRSGSQPPEIAVSVAGSVITAPASQNEMLSELEIEGPHLIEADGSLTLSQIKISDGADVTIMAGNGVAFANGFQVGAQVRLVVGVSPGKAVQEELRAENDHG